MPRRYYRRSSGSRRGSVLGLVVLLVLAVLLLLVLTNRSLLAFLPPLPNITIPITGLPNIQIPTAQIPITLVPGTLVPKIGIGGTAVPNNPQPQAAPPIGARTKSSGCQVQGALPDPACTPGAVMTTDANTVCQRGYASSVRNVPASESARVYKEYGIPSHSPGQYEVDHLISLELGGSNDIANLWPEAANPTPGFHQKDKVENYLHDQVCSGKMSLTEAQRRIASNWLEVYSQMPK